MVLTPVEVIATVMIVLGLVKLLVVLASKKAWIQNVSRPVFKNRGIAGFIFSLLALVIFYYLIQELTIAQILATSLFIGLIYFLSLMHYSKDVLKMMKRVEKEHFSSGQIILIILWFVLLIWGALEIFFL